MWTRPQSTINEHQTQLEGSSLKLSRRLLKKRLAPWLVVLVTTISTLTPFPQYDDITLPHMGKGLASQGWLGADQAFVPGPSKSFQLFPTHSAGRRLPSLHPQFWGSTKKKSSEMHGLFVLLQASMVPYLLY